MVLGIIMLTVYKRYVKTHVKGVSSKEAITEAVSE